MAEEKARLYDLEYNKGRKMGKHRLYEQVGLLLVIVITSLTLLVSFISFYSWNNSSSKLNVISMGSVKKDKPPFNPPPYKELAKTARYIAHYMDWGVVSTISADDGFPCGLPLSISDGPVDNSTGVPYIYIAIFDPVVKNMNKNPKASFSFSEAQTDYCSRNNYDPEFPLCARLVLYGEMVNVTAAEIPFAKQAMFPRHPGMKDWPALHHFFFVKLKITRVSLLDYFGAIKEIPVKDYFAAKP